MKLTVSPVRGVVEWSGVTYEELPAGVQEQYGDLENGDSFNE